MSRPRLTYFDFSGSRGEECRLALFLAGVDFEDHRIKREEWPALKPTTPYGSLPILEIEGKGTLAQSNAILTFVGRQHDLLPSDAWEMARHESVMGAAEDLRTAIGQSIRISDEAQKKAARETLATTTIPQWGARLEAQIRGPFVGGEAISVADLKIFTMVNWIRAGVLDHIPTTVLDAFPKVIGVRDAVANHPRVQAWYAR